jgi:hypothetical protein
MSAAHSGKFCHNQIMWASDNPYFSRFSPRLSGKLSASIGEHDGDDGERPGHGVHRGSYTLQTQSLTPSCPSTVISVAVRLLLACRLGSGRSVAFGEREDSDPPGCHCWVK